MATPMRLGLRAARQPILRQNLRFTQRRAYATAETVAEPATESGMAKFWNSPVGPKAVHFWAPIMKVRAISTSMSCAHKTSDGSAHATLEQHANNTPHSGVSS